MGEKPTNFRRMPGQSLWICLLWDWPHGCHLPSATQRLPRQDTHRQNSPNPREVTQKKYFGEKQDFKSTMSMPVILALKRQKLRRL
jgi:hypothetical protein